MLKPRGVNLLEVEDRSRAPQADDEEHGDYEVTGLMCDSDGECGSIEIESQENTFCISCGDPNLSGISCRDFDYEFVRCVCGPEEEIATILLDVSRVVLPPADEAGEAETHHVLGTFSALLTFLIYAVGKEQGPKAKPAA